jgi:hypothetical protein
MDIDRRLTMLSFLPGTIPMFDRTPIDPAVPIIASAAAHAQQRSRAAARPVRPKGARTLNGREHGGNRLTLARQIDDRRSAKQWTR